MLRPVSRSLPLAQIVTFTRNGEEDLVEMPLIARLGAPALPLIGIVLAECAPPLADGFVGHDHPTDA